MELLIHQNINVQFSLFSEDFEAITCLNSPMLPCFVSTYKPKNKNQQEMTFEEIV